MLSVAALAIPLTLILAGCAGGTLPQGNEPGSEPAPGFFPVAPVTQAGQATQNLYTATFVIAVIVFFIVEGLLLWITLRYRRRRGDDELPVQTHGNNVLEILWTIVPAITVTALFIAAINTLNNETEAKSPNPAVTIDVTAFQFQWTFDYPDQGLSFTGAGREGPVMVVPVNEPVHVRLHSTGVIHSFYVPQFLYKKDVVPGRTNEFQFVVQQPGTFAGQCAEFCGLGHADMHFTVQAMPRAEFDAWVAQAQQPPSPGPSQPAPPPGAQAVNVSAVGITQGFNPSELSIAANQPWTVNFTNADPSVPHDFSVHKANADGTDWQGTPFTPGGGTAVYNPPPLAAGDYQFFCSIHPNMVGTLHVGQ